MLIIPLFLALTMTPADIELAARTVWGEARSESFAGMLAVAHVIKNRVTDRHRRENTIAGVVTEPSQFSCWLDADPNKQKLESVGPNDFKYLLAMRAVLEAWTGDEDQTNGATHYHTRSMDLPYWAVGKEPSARIGEHIFYAGID